MGRQLSEFAMKRQFCAVGVQLQARVVSPARQPLQQFAAGQKQRLAIHFPSVVDLRQPLDELPVFRRKELLFVSRPRRQFDDFAQRFVLFAGARTRQGKLDPESMQVELAFERSDLTLDPQTRAWRVQVRVRWWQQPVFQLLNKFLFLLGLCDFSKAFEIGVRQQFSGQRTIRAQEEQGGLLQPRLAPGPHQARPPVLAGKILAREREPLEVILQQQPGPLWIGAVGKVLQPFSAFGDSGLGIGELASQISKSAVGFFEHDVVGIVLGGGNRTRSVSVFV